MRSGEAWAQTQTRPRTAPAPGPSAAAPLPIPPPLPVPSGDRLGFRLLRKGDVIGSHLLTFARQGEQLVVSIAIDILVKFGPIPVYRYSHRASERWVGDRFMGIESRTDRDGKDLVMKAARGPEGLVVEGSFGPRYVAPAGVLPSTYWNKAMLTGQVINSEDGELMKVPFQERGDEAVPTATGSRINARRYRLGGDLPLDIWYDAAGQWAHLVFEKNGTSVIYEKL
jgi:hypothetical protein